MSLLLPTAAILRGLVGTVRSVGEADRKARINAVSRMWNERNRDKVRAYHREYYHRTNQKAKRAARRKARSGVELAQSRARNRMRYWRDPERFRAAARERMRALYARRKACAV